MAGRLDRTSSRFEAVWASSVGADVTFAATSVCITVSSGGLLKVVDVYGTTKTLPVATGGALFIQAVSVVASGSTAYGLVVHQ